MSDSVLKFLEVGTAVANEHRGTPILFTWKTSKLERKKSQAKSHPNMLPLLSNNGDVNIFFLLSSRGSHTSRCTEILDASTRFGSRELRTRAISLKMVKPQLEEDKVVVPIFITLWARSGA
jgi:hypothetical protein